MRTRSFLAGKKRLLLRAEPPRLKGIQCPPAGFCQNYGRDEHISVKIIQYCFEDLLARGDLVHFGVRQSGAWRVLGWRRWWGVDGRTLIETSSVGKSPSVLVLHLAVDVHSEESRHVQTEVDLPLSHLTTV